MCGTAYANPMPTRKQLDYIYNDVFTYPVEFSKSDTKGYSRYIFQIEKLLSQRSGRLLDIGCASGLLLSRAVAQGWEAFGLDTSERLLEVALQRVPQASLFPGPIESAGYGSDYFDAVIALNLLEHLRDPVKLLEEVDRVLRPGGIFLFKTVRIDSIPARKRKMNWDHLKWPGHLIWYSKKSLDLVLQNANFRVRKSQVTGVPYIPGVKRYMDHRITNNQCEDTGTTTQRQFRTSMPLMKRILRIMLGNSLLKSCGSTLNSTFRLGDTITVYAEKKAAGNCVDRA